MVQRSIALYNGRIIGIESIFTYIDGKQINIPEKLEWLREKSDNRELICPCGCGAKLVLVAGSIRDQHFRLLPGQNIKCEAVTEGEGSVNSKIVLKCWLDDKLQANDVESHVPIALVEDTDRKYEYSLLSRDKKIAINYSYKKANIDDEKLDILESNTQGIRVLHVVDAANSITSGQYPERLMKIQERQGFCLFLLPVARDYEKARLKVVLYEKNLRGLWEEVTIAEDRLQAYSFDAQGDLLLSGKRIIDLCNDRALAKAEREKAFKESLEERERQGRKRAADAAMEKAQADAKKQKEREELSKNLDKILDEAMDAVMGPDGFYVAKCAFCGKIAREDDFPVRGIPGHYAIGACKDCYEQELKDLPSGRRFAMTIEAFKRRKRL